MPEIQNIPALELYRQFAPNRRRPNEPNELNGAKKLISWFCDCMAVNAPTRRFAAA